MCGADQRCRQPSSTFTLAPGPVPFVAVTFHAGDVDGDGFADLTGVEGTRLDVLYSDGSGDLASSTAQILPTAGNDPAFGDLDGDGRSDVLVPVANGVVTLLGGAGGYDLHPYALLDLSPIVGALRIEQARTGFAAPSDVFFAYDEFTSGSAAVHDEIGYPGSVFQTCFDGTVLVGGGDDCGSTGAGSATIESLLDGDVAIGHTGLVWTCASPLGSGAACGSAAIGDDPTDEVAIAIGSASKVALLTSTGTGLGSGIGDPASFAFAHAQDIALDSKSKVATAGHMTFADLDGDGCDDLAIPTSGNYIALAFNARGTGGAPCTGVLSATAVDVPSTAITASPLASRGTPRLFVDLDGDGVADLVTSTQIYIATCGGGCRTAYTATAVALAPRAWSAVVAGDFNDDGHMDLAGFVADSQNVDVLLNNGSGEFTRFTLITDLPVRELVAGDFDGDFIQDLAVVTGEAGTVDEADQLAISYGQLAGGPTDPLTMGTFGAIDAMARLDVAFDTITNLVIADDHSAARSGTVLLGTTTRQVIAPFQTSLAPGQGAGSVTPSVVLMSSFDSAPGTDLVELTANPTPSAYLVPGTGSGGLGSGASYTGTGLAAQFAPKVTTSWSAAVLTPGGLASVVGVTTVPAAASMCGATDLVIADPPRDGGSDWTVSAEQTLVAAGSGTCTKVHGMSFRDLDGDGASDATIQMCSTTTCQVSQTLLAWGNAAGGVDLSDVVTLPEPAGMACGRYTELAPVAGAPPILIAPCTPRANATPDFAAPVLEVLALTKGSPHGTWARIAVLPITASDLRTGIGDFNGDGLVDFALTSGLGDDGIVQVYLQCPANDPSCVAIAPLEAP